MKTGKLLLALLLLAVCLAAAGCSGATADVADGEPVGDAPAVSQPAEAPKTDAEIVSAMEAASDFALHWFYDCIYIDEDDTISGNYVGTTDWPFHKVNYPGIASFDDLRQLTLQYYTPEITDQLMGYLGWIETSSGLYVSEPEGLGGGMPIDAQVSIHQEDSTCYRITVTPYCLGELLRDPYEVRYQAVDGNWVFDTSLLLFASTITVV